MRAGSSVFRIRLADRHRLDFAHGVRRHPGGRLVSRLLPDRLLAPRAARRLRVRGVEDPLARAVGGDQLELILEPGHVRCRRPELPAPAAAGQLVRQALARARARGGRPRVCAAGRGAGSGAPSRKCVECASIRARNRLFRPGAAVSDTRRRGPAWLSRLLQLRRRHDEGTDSKDVAAHGPARARRARRHGRSGHCRSRRSTRRSCDQGLPAQVGIPARPVARKSLQAIRAGIAVERDGPAGGSGPGRSGRRRRSSRSGRAAGRARSTLVRPVRPRRSPRSRA